VQFIWHAVLATAALTGLRGSELRGLRWSRVRLDDHPIVQVRERADEHNKIGAPKSHAGDRDVPIDGALATILRQWWMKAGRPADKLVFGNGKGNVESHANIANRGLYKIQRDLGMLDPEGSPKYGMHSLRHFFASITIEQNHLPKRVQEMLGHSSLAMTYDLYGHLFAVSAGEREKIAAAGSFLIATKDG
jgi:integrase